ncbi:hypothetical protein MLD52_07935 [Puniceicoccaceae bacterium K14]|nr:hypothetical protein [Puniceicoccaceae bacterium K14]
MFKEFFKEVAERIHYATDTWKIYQSSGEHFDFDLMLYREAKRTGESEEAILEAYEEDWGKRNGKSRTSMFRSFDQVSRETGDEAHDIRAQSLEDFLDRRRYGKTDSEFEELTVKNQLRTNYPAVRKFFEPPEYKYANDLSGGFINRLIMVAEKSDTTITDLFAELEKALPLADEYIYSHMTYDGSEKHGISVFDDGSHEVGRAELILQMLERGVELPDSQNDVRAINHMMLNDGEFPQTIKHIEKHLNSPEFEEAKAKMQWLYSSSLEEAPTR